MDNKQRIIELLCSSDKENIELAEMLCLSQNINLEELLKEYGYFDICFIHKADFLNHRSFVFYGNIGNYQVNYVPKLLPNKIIGIIAIYENDFLTLTELPKLDERTTELRCSNHELEQLPDLPNNLCKLFCSDNKLTSLPELPDTLGILDCNHNQLTHILNKHMPNLRELICHGNPLIQSLDEIRTLVPEFCYVKY